METSKTNSEDAGNKKYWKMPVQLQDNSVKWWLQNIAAAADVLATASFPNLIFNDKDKRKEGLPRKNTSIMDKKNQLKYARWLFFAFDKN